MVPIRTVSTLEVLAVMPSGVVGGAERWLLSVVDATDRLAVSAVLLADGPLRGELERRGIPVTLRRVGSSPAEVARAVWWLRAHVRRVRPHVVVGNGVKAHAVTGPACALAGVPTVWVKHDHSHDARLARPLGRLATRVVATCRQVGDPVGRGDVVVVEPPRPHPALPPARSRQRLRDLGCPDDSAPLLVMVTRLVPYKGVDTAVQALALPPGSPWRLAVIGDDDPSSPGERERISALATRVGVRDRVHLIGAVPDAGRLLSGADAVAVLTRPDGAQTPGREGAGMVALEAMVAGVPVIAPDDGGPVVQRLKGEAGIGVDASDAAAVASALGRLTDPGRRAAMGAAGAHLVTAHPDAATCAASFAGVLAQAARRPGRGIPSGPPVSVVTTALNDGAALEAMLQALIPQLSAHDEVVVVDGGSTDDTSERLAWWTSDEQQLVRLVRVPGAGISAGRNIGIKAARHDLVACTDAGCKPVDGWVDAMRAAAAEDSKPDLLTGTYRATSARRDALHEAMAVVGYPDPDEARRPDLLVRAYGALFGRVFDPTLPTGRSMTVRRQAWEAAGGFPEHLDTAEDVLFGKAVVAAGGSAVLVTDAEVSWQQRATLRDTLRMYARYGYGGGRSGSPLLVGRDLARAAAYTAAPVLLWRGGWKTRTALGLAAVAYLSLPVARARRHERWPVVVACVPAAAALRDLAKACGCVQGTIERLTSARDGHRR